MATRKFREFTRHFCDEHNSIVTPFSKYEARTEAPVGEQDAAVLLRSYNNRSKDHRMAWCFVCNDWTNANRRGEKEMREMYTRRKGVFIRGKVSR